MVGGGAIVVVDAHKVNGINADVDDDCNGDDDDDGDEGHESGEEKHE